LDVKFIFLCFCLLCFEEKKRKKKKKKKKEIRRRKKSEEERKKNFFATVFSGKKGDNTWRNEGEELGCGFFFFFSVILRNFTDFLFRWTRGTRWSP